MKINFDKKIYKKKAVLKAIEAYAGFAKFSLIETKYDMEVVLTVIDKELELYIGEEFCNYVLWMQKNI